MRKLCSYILLIVVLLQATPVQQLLKIPVLLEHFSEHQLRNPGISFFQFMSMHYFGQDEADNDQDRDMQLPFKKVGNPQVHYEVYTPAAPLLFPTMITWATLSGYPAYHQDHLPDSYKGSLFKPPRA